MNTVDFLYTCPVHLTDPNFASPLGESNDGVAGGSRKMGLSTEEIAKVKEEWEERQKKKLEKEQAKKKEEESKKDKGKEKESEEGKKSEEKEKTAESNNMIGSLPSGVSTPTPTPSHQRFTLHRDFFAMRLAEHRKRRQMAQVRELAPRLPGAPSGALPNSS
jgi:AAA-ATPase Vps4-associated protein 1